MKVDPARVQDAIDFVQKAPNFFGRTHVHDLLFKVMDEITKGVKKASAKEFVLRVDNQIVGRWEIKGHVPDWALRYGPRPQEDLKLCKEKGSSSWYCNGQVCVTIE
jgi:hypothetical protein